MTSILFYIMIGYYYFNFWTVNNFNPIGNEFVTLTILGLLAILQRQKGH